MEETITILNEETMRTLTHKGFDILW